jgi:hypothetical protein
MRNLKLLNKLKTIRNPLRVNKTAFLQQLNKELSKPEYDHITEENKALYVEWVGKQIDGAKRPTLHLISQEFAEESRKIKIALGFKEKAYE